MASYEVKYRAGSEVNSVVLVASDESSAGKAFASSHQGVSSNDIISVRSLSAYKSDYGAAKFVGALISFVGWVVFVLGIVGGLWGVTATIGIISQNSGYSPVSAITGAVAVFSFLFALIGLFMAGAGQHFRATADSANHTAEMLALMKLGKA